MAKVRYDRTMKRGYVVAIAGACMVLIVAVFAWQLALNSPEHLDKKREDTLASVQKHYNQNLMVGDKNAPVKLIEYADLECTYCAKAHVEVLKAIKKEYIDTGKVLFETRLVDMIGTHSKAAAVGANCAGKQGKLWQYIDASYTAFWNIKQSGEKKEIHDEASIAELAKQAELDVPAWQTCRKEQSFDAEFDKVREEMTQLGISGTPYFLVNDKPYNGVPSESVLKALIETAITEKR